MLVHAKATILFLVFLTPLVLSSSLDDDHPGENKPLFLLLSAINVSAYGGNFFEVLNSIFETNPPNEDEKEIFWSNLLERDENVQAIFSEIFAKHCDENTTNILRKHGRTIFYSVSQKRFDSLHLEAHFKENKGGWSCEFVELISQHLFYLQLSSHLFMTYPNCKASYEQLRVHSTMWLPFIGKHLEALGDGKAGLLVLVWINGFILYVPFRKFLELPPDFKINSCLDKENIVLAKKLSEIAAQSEETMFLHNAVSILITNIGLPEYADMLLSLIEQCQKNGEYPLHNLQLHNDDAVDFIEMTRSLYSQLYNNLSCGNLARAGAITSLIHRLFRQRKTLVFRGCELATKEQSHYLSSLSFDDALFFLKTDVPLDNETFKMIFIGKHTERLVSTPFRFRVLRYLNAVEEPASIVECLFKSRLDPDLGNFDSVLDWWLLGMLPPLGTYIMEAYPERIASMIAGYVSQYGLAELSSFSLQLIQEVQANTISILFVEGPSVDDETSRFEQCLASFYSDRKKANLVAIAFYFAFLSDKVIELLKPGLLCLIINALKPEIFSPHLATVYLKHCYEPVRGHEILVNGILKTAPHFFMELVTLLPPEQQSSAIMAIGQDNIDLETIIIQLKLDSVEPAWFFEMFFAKFATEEAFKALWNKIKYNGLYAYFPLFIEYFSKDILCLPQKDAAWIVYGMLDHFKVNLLSLIDTIMDNWRAFGDKITLVLYDLTEYYRSNQCGIRPSAKIVTTVAEIYRELRIGAGDGLFLRDFEKKCIPL